MPTGTLAVNDAVSERVTPAASINFGGEDLLGMKSE